MGDHQAPYVTIRSRRPTDGMSMSSGDSTYGSSAGDDKTPSATHDTSRVSYHVKHLSDFAKTLEDSAARAFPNRGRSQRYQNVQALLLHWKSDDLFVLPELEDLERCLREEYSYETAKFAIPSDNSHLELMMRIGQMVKDHESTDTLFVIYYGGHARIDDSRQSTWCATRTSDSPWLQWSAIQTLLERSLSDVLVLLDCCAGAASATFPTGNSITETISASSWDAIAPDPGRYSFTSTLIEVLQAWKNRTYSAAMLHAEILARLKHPRPIMLNGRQFEARSTPVHFMMTSNHRAPSIEMAKLVSDEQRPPSPLPGLEGQPPAAAASGRSAPAPGIHGSEPNEDVPHVMISLALEDDQRLDVNAWENWLEAFPAIAKYVKVQGFFKSHSNLLLLSLPIMVWDLLPEDLACNFIGFIRSNNLAIRHRGEEESRVIDVPARAEEEISSTFAGETAIARGQPLWGATVDHGFTRPSPSATLSQPSRQAPESFDISASQDRSAGGHWIEPNIAPLSRQYTAPAAILSGAASNDAIAGQPILNQARNSRRTLNTASKRLPNRPDLALHVQSRLDAYFQDNPAPTLAIIEFLASNLGIEVADIDSWFAHRRDQQEVADRLQTLGKDPPPQGFPREGPRMILPGHLNKLLEVLPLDRILFVDLRSAVEYQRSHIHEAVNVRAPASFLQRASIEMIEKTLTDEVSRDIFNRWYTAKCVVFYDRHVEFAWECPSAEALYQKFKAKIRTLHGFVLKGHYREFSAAFDKYIGGQKISSGAKKFLESLQDKSSQKKKEDYEDYEQWLRSVEDEDRVPPVELAPAVKNARIEAVVKHQKELEDELERRQPPLYRKAQDLNPTDNWDLKAELVEHLSRGLSKMQEATGKPGETAKQSYHRSAEKKLRSQYSAEDLDPGDPDEEHEEAPQKGGQKASEDMGGSGTADAKKGRGRNLLKILRSGR